MIPQELKDILNNISEWKAFSFPNGSSYRQQQLPHTFDKEIQGVKIEKVSGGHYVTWQGEEYHIPYRWQAVGSGVDLGVHFCSRDQALVELM